MVQRSIAVTGTTAFTLTSPLSPPFLLSYLIHPPVAGLQTILTFSRERSPYQVTFAHPSCHRRQFSFLCNYAMERHKKSWEWQVGIGNHTIAFDRTDNSATLTSLSIISTSSYLPSARHQHVTPHSTGSSIVSVSSPSNYNILATSTSTNTRWWWWWADGGVQSCSYNFGALAQPRNTDSRSITSVLPFQQAKHSL